MTTSTAHILVADDDPELIQEILLTYGYDVTVAPHGRAALEALQRQPFLFDLLILDILLPVVNGWEVLRQLRNKSTYNQLPVMMLSALDAEADQVSGLRYGADDYITKPFRIPTFLARLEALLRRSQWRKQSPLHEEINLPSVEFSTPTQPLTEREREILSLMGCGLSNRDIAQHLVVSELTVKTHLKNLFKKLHVSSRTQAVLVGMKEQLMVNPLAQTP